MPGGASHRSNPFPTTRWSLVGRAASPGTDNGRLALGELVQIYLPALKAHLTVAMRIDPHRADDLLQGFLADKVLQQNIISQADRGRGKFRTFLLTALERFAVDEFRRESAKSRSPRTPMLDVDDQADSVPATSRSPSAIFDRIWATEALGEVMRRMRDELRDGDREHIWSIFESRVLLPISDGVAPLSHEELAARFNLPSASHASNALGSAKRVFRRIFRAVVAEYARDDAEIDAEIRELWEIFSRPDA
jgi:RNA polymerase sigma-70 factor (ECF subfamily)